MGGGRGARGEVMSGEFEGGCDVAVAGRRGRDADEFDELEA